MKTKRFVIEPGEPVFSEQSEDEREREQWTRKQWIEAYISGSENRKEDGSPWATEYIGRYLCYSDECDPSEDPSTWVPCDYHRFAGDFIDAMVWVMVYRRLIGAAARMVDPDILTGHGLVEREAVVDLILESFPLDGESNRDTVEADIRAACYALWKKEDEEA